MGLVLKQRLPAEWAEPVVPSDPRRAPEIQLLLAHIAAHEANPAGGPAAEAQFESARRKILAEVEAGRLAWKLNRLGVARDLRWLFALEWTEHAAQLLGGHGLDGAFQPGLAQLSQREREVLMYSMAGHPAEKIVKMLSPSKRYGMPESIGAVDGALARARRKLRELFGQPVDHPS